MDFKTALREYVKESFATAVNDSFMMYASLTDKCADRDEYEKVLYFYRIDSEMHIFKVLNESGEAGVEQLKSRYKEYNKKETEAIKNHQIMMSTPDKFGGQAVFKSKPVSEKNFISIIDICYDILCPGWLDSHAQVTVPQSKTAVITKKRSPGKSKPAVKIYTDGVNDTTKDKTQPKSKEKTTQSTTNAVISEVQTGTISGGNGVGRDANIAIASSGNGGNVAISGNTSAIISTGSITVDGGAGNISVGNNVGNGNVIMFGNNYGRNQAISGNMSAMISTGSITVDGGAGNISVGNNVGNGNVIMFGNSYGGNQAIIGNTTAISTGPIRNRDRTGAIISGNYNSGGNQAIIGNTIAINTGPIENSVGTGAIIRNGNYNSGGNQTIIGNTTAISTGPITIGGIKTNNSGTTAYIDNVRITTKDGVVNGIINNVLRIGPGNDGTAKITVLGKSITVVGGCTVTVGKDIVQVEPVQGETTIIDISSKKIVSQNKPVTQKPVKVLGTKKLIINCNDIDLFVEVSGEHKKVSAHCMGIISFKSLPINDNGNETTINISPRFFKSTKSAFIDVPADTYKSVVINAQKTLNYEEKKDAGHIYSLEINSSGSTKIQTTAEESVINNGYNTISYINNHNGEITAKINACEADILLPNIGKVRLQSNHGSKDLNINSNEYTVNSSGINQAKNGKKSSGLKTSAHLVVNARSIYIRQK